MPEEDFRFVLAKPASLPVGFPKEMFDNPAKPSYNVAAFAGFEHRRTFGGEPRRYGGTVNTPTRRWLGTPVGAAEFFLPRRASWTPSSLKRREVGPLPTTVVLRPGESQEQLLKRFRKQVAKSGILSAVRRKRWYVSKSELRRIQKKKAIRRLRRRLRKMRKND